MTVSSSTNRISYAGDGSTVTFSFPYYFLANGDLKVIKVTNATGAEAVQTITTHYSVTGAGVEAGGSITMVTAPANTETLIIYRDPSITQTTDYTDNDPFPAATHETALDKLTMHAIRTREIAAQSIRLSEQESDVTRLDVPENRAGKFLGFDGTGAPSLNVTITNTDQPVFSIRSSIAAATIDAAVTHVRTAGYTTTGDGGGALYAKAVSEPSHAGKVQSADGAWWEYIPGPEGVSTLAFGAIADGSTDDSTAVGNAIAYAATNGLTVLLENAHKLNSTITLTGTVVLKPRYNGCTLSRATAGTLFSSTATNVHIEGVTVSGDHSIMEQTGNFTKIVFRKNTLTGAADTLANYMIWSDGDDITGTRLEITECTVNQAVLAFLDDVAIADAIVTFNTINQPPRWGYRSLKQIGTSDNGNLTFAYNRVDDINGDITDKSNVARAVQFEGTGTLRIENNKFFDAESTTATNVAYVRSCSLFFSDNEVKDYLGVSSVSIIDDKSTTTTDDKHWHISRNRFDFRGVAYADRPEAIVRINEQRHVQIHNNFYIGLTCYVVRIYHSIDTGNYPRDITVCDEQVHDHDWPVVVQVFQNITKVTVTDIHIHNITNSNAESVNGETRCRILDIYQTFANGADIEDVTLKGSTIQNGPANTVLCTLYRNASATTSTITGVSIFGNELKNITTPTSAAWVRFKTGNEGAVDVINNVGPDTMAQKVGTVPSGSRFAGNKPNGDAGELTIATGAITAFSEYHTVDTESNAASDDLDTINGGWEGMVLTISAAASTRTVVAKDGTGNLKLAGDMSLDNAEDTLTLRYNGTNWLEISRSDNGA